jgi:hypothetical protein
VRPRVAGQILASAPPRVGVDQDLRPLLEERLREGFLAGSEARVDLGPRDGAGIRPDPARLQVQNGLRDRPPASQDLDDDVGIEEDAG